MDLNHRATILFAHGARNPAWRKPLETIRAAMLERQPEVRVEIAFLEFLRPSLPEAIDLLAEEGRRDLVIVPVFMAQSGHTQRDLPALLTAAGQRHPEVAVRVAAPIGEVPSVVESIARYALDPAVGTAR